MQHPSPLEKDGRMRSVLACLFFFATPKKNQKKSPEIEYSPISGSSFMELLIYCNLCIGNPTL